MRKVGKKPQAEAEQSRLKQHELTNATPKQIEAYIKKKLKKESPEVQEVMTILAKMIILKP